MLIAALVVGTIMGALGVGTRRAKRRRVWRAAERDARSRAERHRLVAARLDARGVSRTHTVLPRCPDCGEVFKTVEELWAHLDDHH